MAAPPDYSARVIGAHQNLRFASDVHFAAINDAEGTARGPIGMLKLQAADLDHFAHGDAHALDGDRTVGDRVVLRGRGHDAGQHGRLGEIQFISAVTKIELRGRFDAIILIGQENFVQVEFQDEVLVVSIGNFQRHQNLVDLSLQRDLGIVQHQIAGDLLRDGAGARFDAAAADVLV